MASSVLVAYASKYGSTKEVAEAVGKTLEERGLVVEVAPAGKVGALEGYDAVVVGAPLYIGSLLGEARTFLERNQAGLSAVPVALFALGPLGDDEAEGSREQLDTQLAKFPWFRPNATEVFVGAYDPAKLRFPDSLLGKFPASPLKDVPAKDGRDWDAIRSWADTLPATLGIEG